MSEFVIRPLAASEMGEAVRLWNECRPADPITPRVFKRKVVLDVNFNRKGYLVCEYEGKLVGYVHVIIRSQPVDNDGDMEIGKGTVNAFGVLPGAPEGTGDALLDACDQYARDNNLTKLVHSSYKPYYFTQGFDVEREKEYIDLFLKHGFTIDGPSYARDIDLLQYQVPEELKEARKKAEADGFYIGALSDETLLAFWDFMNEYQSGSWRIRIRQLLRDTDDYGRCRIIAYKGEVVGFTVFGDPDGSAERFGPFGVRAEFRGYKLGQLLLADCLYEMKCRGLHNCWMQSTGSGSAADHVYEKAGFIKSRTHVPMTKIL